MATQPIETDLVKLYLSTDPKHLLICTYTLDHSFLEYSLLKDFRNNGSDTNITVITSELGLQESFNEGSVVRETGMEYLSIMLSISLPFIPRYFS